MAKPLVLLVDDDPLHIDLMREILEYEGYRVAPARNIHAVAMARQVRPSLILLDILMPGVSGIELCRRLRADPQASAIPIVAVSAALHLLADPALPVNDRLEKPFLVTAFSEVVARWAEPVDAPEAAHTV